MKFYMKHFGPWLLGSNEFEKKWRKKCTVSWNIFYSGLSLTLLSLTPHAVSMTQLQIHKYKTICKNTDEFGLKSWKTGLKSCDTVPSILARSSCWKIKKSKLFEIAQISSIVLETDRRTGGTVCNVTVQ